MHGNLPFARCCGVKINKPYSVVIPPKKQMAKGTLGFLTLQLASEAHEEEGTGADELHVSGLQPLGKLVKDHPHADRQEGDGQQAGRATHLAAFESIAQPC